MNELEQQLGIATSQPRFKIYKVDNGDDKKGTNATGEWVEKSRNDQKQIERIQHGKKLTGNVLMVRSKVNSKYRDGADGWYSDEFNSLNTNDLINIRKGKEIIASGTYKQLKEKYSVDNGDGTRTNNFTYSTILYFTIEGEVVKIQLNGKSQGNWFEFQNSLKMTESLLRTQVIAEIVSNEDSYMATFSKGEITSYEDNINLAKSILPAQSIQAPQSEAEAPQIAPSDDYSHFGDDDIPIIEGVQF